MPPETATSRATRSSTAWPGPGSGSGMPRGRWSSPPGRFLLLVWWSFSFGEVGSTQGTDGRTPGMGRENQPRSPQHPAGGRWASWGSWSACSSKCGEGASLRTRRCIRLPVEHPCTGEARQYRVCTTQTCPPDAVPFRAMQCALYNWKPLLGNEARYQWVPFHGAPNSCDLNCLAVGHNFYYTFGRVLDGTRCSADTEDICINGRCLAAGCDGILGSGVSVDVCGTCRGMNNSCVFIQRVFRAAFPSSGFFGYKNVTRIPAGATHIKVMDHSRNFLALMNGNRRYVINGDWAVSWPGVYEVAGTKVNYKRSPDNHESIEAVGPTQEDLHIMVLFQEQNPGIEYEFWLPSDRSSIFHGESSPLSQLQPQEVDVGSWMWITLPTDHTRVTTTLRPPQTMKRPAGTTAPTAGGCGKCREAKGRSQRIRSYCRSDFVFRARILAKRLFRQETRYDVQVKHTYKNRYPIVHREYIWASNVCDCPLLLQRREYLVMAQRHVNLEQTLNRILLEHHSYVRPWTPREDLQLRDVQGHCAPPRTGVV